MGLGLDRCHPGGTRPCLDKLQRQGKGGMLELSHSIQLFPLEAPESGEKPGFSGEFLSASLLVEWSGDLGCQLMWLLAYGACMKGDEVVHNPVCMEILFRRKCLLGSLFYFIRLCHDI
jgi:hypothetical protein